MKRVLPLIVIALAGAAAGAWYVLDSRAGEDDDRLLLYGNVDIRQVDLGFRVSGRLAEMRFEEGDVVAAGDLLAMLDDQPFREDVDLARAEVAAQAANVLKYETGTRPEEIASARAIVREHEAALANAELTLSRRARLVGTGAVSQQAHDDAVAARDEAAARLESAREQLELALAGFRAEDIAAARATLDAARARLAQTETRLADTELQAPADGVILTRVEEPGAIVSEGQTVYTLTLTSPVWVRTYVSEPDLGRIHPGMAAAVTTDSAPDTAYHGQIGFISPVAEFTPRSVETPELRTDLVYRLRVIVTDPDAGLRQGMPVTVTLDTSASAG